MKKFYNAPQAEVINLAAMGHIANLQDRAAEDDGDDPVFSGGSSGTADKDGF